MPHLKKCVSIRPGLTLSVAAPSPSKSSGSRRLEGGIRTFTSSAKANSYISEISQTIGSRRHLISSIVDIRQLDSAKDAAHYVAKYVTKGTNAEVWHTQSAAQEWILAMKGVRTVLTYGTWRGYKLLQVKEEAKDWTPITSMIELCAACDRHEEWAIALMLQLDEKRLAREKHKPPDPHLFEN